MTFKLVNVFAETGSGSAWLQTQRIIGIYVEPGLYCSRHQLACLFPRPGAGEASDVGPCISGETGQGNVQAVHAPASPVFFCVLS